MRLPPTTTPPVTGEEFNYQPVPEPTESVVMSLLTLSVLLGLKFTSKRKIKAKDKLGTMPLSTSDDLPALPYQDGGF